MPTKHEKYMKEREGIGAFRIRKAAFLASLWDTRTGDGLYKRTGKINRLQLI